MRKLDKENKPSVLAENESNWLEAFRNNQTETNKTRYRHSDIKSALKEETGYKCVYCESKIGHNTPGDIEHKKPISKFPDLAFDWDNLTIACTECNRRKNDYYSSNDDDRFLDPYEHDVESMLIHRGPVVVSATGCTNAEISINLLELDSKNRVELILKKIEKMKDIDERIRRINAETDNVLKTVLKKALESMAERTEEYSGMVMAILNECYSSTE